MTSTTAEADTLNLSPDTLTLVEVSQDAWDEDSNPTPVHPTWDRDGDRIFYATTPDAVSGHVTMVIGPDDPRGGWLLYAPYTTRLGLDSSHKGWNVPRRYVSLVEDKERPASADMDETARRALPIEVAYPVGSRWAHVSRESPVTVTGWRGEGEVLVEHSWNEGNPHPRVTDGVYRGAWVRGALDSFGTFLGWAEESTESPETGEDTPAGTLTQADVDKAVAEALAAKEKEWEETLIRFNGIAVEYAEDNELCGNFERCMDDLGLLGRDDYRAKYGGRYQDYVVEFRVSTTARTPADARDQALEQLSHESIGYLSHHVSSVYDADGDEVW